MAKIKEWLGDDFSNACLPDDTNRRLIDFCNSHSSVTIFGAGKVGKGLEHYLSQCDVAIAGFVTSGTFDAFVKTYRPNETGLIMGLNDDNLQQVMPMVEAALLEKDVFVASRDYRDRISLFSAEHIREKCALAVNLVTHCNLSCKSCKTFSPVSRPDYYELDAYEKDMRQLIKLGMPVKEIKLTGGEPFLHPDLFDIFRVSRKLFKDAEIVCFTNGTLLHRLDDAQLKELAELKIIFSITEYPMLLEKLKAFYPKADAAGVQYNVIGYEEEKTFITIGLDTRKTAPKYDFYNCFCYNATPTLFLFKGKIYGCSRAALIPYFNERFHTGFELQEADYLDIHHTTAEEIYQFKITRKPFCGYHNNANIMLMEWGMSERKMEEWVYVE